MDEVSTQPNPAVQTPTPPKKSGNFFATFGKIMLGLVIVGLLIFGGYYLGTQNNKNAQISPTPTQPVIKTTTETPTQPTSKPTSSAAKTVKAGLTDGSTSFKPYIVEIPAGWTENHETTPATDRLTITKDGYSLVIYQAAFGGGGCLYKGDPPAELAQNFTDFVAITGSNAQYRRSWNKEGEYNICQKHPTENSYGTPTQFGAISAKSPSPADSSTMAELDSIIASLKQQ